VAWEGHHAGTLNAAGGMVTPKGDHVQRLAAMLSRPVTPNSARRPSQAAATSKQHILVVAWEGHHAGTLNAAGGMVIPQGDHVQRRR